MDSKAVVRPPLKWAGGKRWQLPHLRPLWAAANAPRLVEPFCGGLAVALGLRPAQALLNDANPHLINFYGWVQRGLVISLRMENDEALFYRHRTAFNELLAGRQATTADAAALFYYLNRTGYNGLCRFNLRRASSTCRLGPYTRIAYASDFQALHDVCAAWTFQDRGFRRARRGTGRFRLRRSAV